MPRILIVEDESIVAEDLENTLTDLGYTVIGRATTADDAVSKAIETKPDVILMDIMLRGEKNGITAAHEIGKQIDIPIIYLTAYTDPPIINEAVHTAPYAYLVKPFQGRQIMAAIEMTLYRSKIDLQLRDTRRWLSTTLKSISEAAIAVDIKGQIMYMNHHAEKLTGWNCNTTENTTIDQVFDLIDRSTKERIDVMRRLFDSDEPHNPALIATRTGETHPIHDRHTLVKSDSDTVIGSILLFREDHNT